MILKSNVFGSHMQAQPLIITKNAVFVHSNIKKSNINEWGEPDDNIYTYDEIQYSIEEYISLLSEQNLKLQNELTDTQLALCEVYELISQE